MLSIIVSPPPGASKPSGFTCLLIYLFAYSIIHLFILFIVLERHVYYCYNRTIRFIWMIIKSLYFVMVKRAFAISIKLKGHIDRLTSRNHCIDNQLFSSDDRDIAVGGASLQRWAIFAVSSQSSQSVSQ